MNPETLIVKNTAGTTTHPVSKDGVIKELERLGYTVIPPLISPKLGQYWRNKNSNELFLITSVNGINVELSNNYSKSIRFTDVVLNTMFTLEHETKLVAKLDK